MQTVEFRTAFQDTLVHSVKADISAYSAISINDIVKMEVDKVYKAYTVVGRHFLLSQVGLITGIVFILAPTNMELIE